MHHMVLHVVESDQSVRGRIGSPNAVGSSQQPPHPSGIERKLELHSRGHIEPRLRWLWVWSKRTRAVGGAEWQRRSCQTMDWGDPVL